MNCRRTVGFLIVILLMCFLISCNKTEEMEEVSDVEKVEEKLESEIMDTKENEEVFHYVAIGNSITCNKIEKDLWWGKWGMAASSKEKDYVHRISAWLSEQIPGSVKTKIIDLKSWELSKNRKKTLKKYKECFHDKTDLVTIQTGENITENKKHLEKDYLELVKMIKKQAPNAQIIMLGGILWPSADIEEAKRAACEECEVSFVDMDAFLEEYETSYKSQIGKKVSGSDGKKHKIVNEVVAAHPNDAGMECIAGLIIDHIQLEKY